MNIFVSLNTMEDIYLVSQTKNYLDKYLKCQTYNIDYYNFDFEDFFANGSKYYNFFNVLYNYTNNLELTKNVLLDDPKHLKYVINIFNELDQYDLYCFSVWDGYLDIQLILSLYLKNKYPNSKILIGGPEIILRDFVYNIFRDLGIDCSTGDMEVSLYNYITDYNNFYNKKHKINLNTLNKNDVPKYTQEELQYLDYNIIVSSSRGCTNNCYFCSSPALSSYSFVKRNVLVDWFKYYNDIGVKKVTFNDSTLNKVDFDVLIDGLININNQVKIHTTDISFRDLKFDQIPKMKQAGFDQVCLGLECLHPTLQKKINKQMPSIDDLFKYLDLFEINDINVKLFYIYDIPFQTDEIFYDECEVIEYIDKKYSNICFEFYTYFVSPKSYIFNNPDKFNIQMYNQYDHFVDHIPHFGNKYIHMYSEGIVNRSKRNEYTEYINKICSKKVYMK